MHVEEVRDFLLRHSRSKKNGVLPNHMTHEKKLLNPVCGDEVLIGLEVSRQEIVDVGFATKSCAICAASASILCGEIIGKKTDWVVDVSQDFEEQLLKTESQPWPSRLAFLQSFEHIRNNPARRACALLPWIAVRSIFKQEIQ